MPDLDKLEMLAKSATPDSVPDAEYQTMCEAAGKYPLDCDFKLQAACTREIVLQLIAVVKASMKHLEEYEDVFDMAVPNKHQSKGAKEAQDELRAALLPFQKR